MHVECGTEACSLELNFNDQAVAPRFARAEKDGCSFASDRIVKYIAFFEHNDPIGGRRPTRYLLCVDEDLSVTSSSMDTRENQGQLTSLFRTAYKTISAVL